MNQSTANFAVQCSRTWCGTPAPCECNGTCEVFCDTPGATPTPVFDRGSAIQIDLTKIQQYEPNRFGFAYGALVVPFKYQLMGSHQFTGSASAGPYLGYKIDFESLGWALTPAAFAGASNIAVTNKNTSESNSTSQVAGFSWGGGLLIEIKGGFQGGVVLGWDDVGGLSSNQYFQYNDKPWLALQLGYSFSQ